MNIQIDFLRQNSTFDSIKQFWPTLDTITSLCDGGEIRICCHIHRNLSVHQIQSTSTTLILPTIADYPKLIFKKSLSIIDVQQNITPDNHLLHFHLSSQERISPSLTLRSSSLSLLTPPIQCPRPRARLTIDDDLQ